MPADDPILDDRPEPRPTDVPCRFLRSKGMYVYTEGRVGEPHDDYDSAVYWCLKTAKGYGPDDDLVGGEDCRNAARPCYEAD